MAESKAQRRQISPLSLAFLDVMFCGFGAVILIFLILNRASNENNYIPDALLSAEVKLLEEEILKGKLGLQQVRNTVDSINLEVVQAEGLARQIQLEIDSFLDQLASLENRNPASIENLEKLRADVESLREELSRLQAAGLERQGNNALDVAGDGNRQIASGVVMDGRRTLILLDSSRSMLDQKLANIQIRGRMGPDIMRASPKWRHVAKSVKWVAANLPESGQYQLWEFSNEVSTLVDGSRNSWFNVTDTDSLEDAVAKIDELVPSNGTNLQNAIRTVKELNPPPDIVWLLTDGLPTLGGSPQEAAAKPVFRIGPAGRLSLFEKAVADLPDGISVNVILFPLEGDPGAVSAYMDFAATNNGRLVSPSKDWP